MALPKLKTLNISGFAFVEDCKLSINLPELEVFKYAVLYPAKMGTQSVYYANKVTDEHEAQREKDRATIESIKADIEANCTKLKRDKLSVKIDIRDGRGFKVEGFKLVELSKRSFEELQVLADAEQAPAPRIFWGDW